MSEVVPARVLVVRFAVAMAILAVGPFVLWDLLARFGWPDKADQLAHSEASMLVSLVAFAAVGTFAVWQPVGCPWRPVRALRVFAIYLPVAVAWALFLLAYLAAARAANAPVPAQPGLEYLAAAAPLRPGFWCSVATVVLGAPLAEEIAFRGYLQGALRQALPAWAAIVLTAAAFGAVHGLPYALPIGLLGCLFGWLRERHGSLLPSMLAHAVHNAVIVLVTVLWPGSLDLLYPK